MEASREMQGIMRMPVGDKGGFMEKCVLTNWAWEGWKCRVGMGGKALLNLGKLKHTHTYRERERECLGQRKRERKGWKDRLGPTSRALEFKERDSQSIWWPQRASDCS